MKTGGRFPVLTALLASLALAGCAGPGDRSGPHMWGGGGGMGGLFGPLTMIAIVAAVVAVVLLLVRGLGGSGQDSMPTPPPAAPDKTPLDILKERYARGEIDKAEYEERRKVLED